MVFVGVKNLHGTTDNQAPHGYDSCRDYWESVKHRPFGKCACRDCYNLADVGAHVILSTGGREWYIVPLCQKHNSYHNDETMLVPKDDLALVN